MMGKRNQIIRISFLLVLMLLFLTACRAQAGGEQAKEEPQLKVTGGGQELKVIYYGDRYNETHDEINKRLKQAMEETSPEELPYVPLGEEISIKAENFSTEKFAVTDYILKENGEIRYQEKVAQTSELTPDNGTASFDLPLHPAAFLSSNSEDYGPGKTLRGFVIRADIDGAPFAFAFILRTDADKPE